MIQECGDTHCWVCRVAQANPYDRPWSSTVVGDAEYIRKSEDKATNQFRGQLVSFCKIFELVILNGMCEGGEDGKFTFVSSTDCNVIIFLFLLICLTLKTYLTVGDQTLSHHLPVELSILKEAIHVNAMERG